MKCNDIALLILSGFLAVSGCQRSPVAKSNVLEYFVYDRLDVTKTYQPDIMRWCSNNSYQFKLIVADSSEGMKYTVQKGVNRIPSVIVYDASGNEIDRFIAEHSIYSDLTERINVGNHSPSK